MAIDWQPIQDAIEAALQSEIDEAIAEPVQRLHDTVLQFQRAFDSTDQNVGELGDLLVTWGNALNSSGWISEATMINNLPAWYTSRMTTQVEEKFDARILAVISRSLGETPAG